MVVSGNIGKKLFGLIVVDFIIEGKLKRKVVVLVVIKEMVLKGLFIYNFLMK